MAPGQLNEPAPPQTSTTPTSSFYSVICDCPWLLVRHVQVVSSFHLNLMDEEQQLLIIVYMHVCIFFLQYIRYCFSYSVGVQYVCPEFAKVFPYLLFLAMFSLKPTTCRNNDAVRMSSADTSALGVFLVIHTAFFTSFCAQCFINCM